MNLNSMKQKHRNTAERELDKKFSSDLWKRGFSIRDIEPLLTEYHTELNNPYRVNYVTISRDINEVIKEAKSLREKAGINDLDDIILKEEDIYHKAMQQYFFSPNPAYLNVADKVLERLAKLKGLEIEKQEIKIIYDINVE